MELISLFDFEITYIPGESNTFADALSRVYSDEPKGVVRAQSEYVQDLSGLQLPASGPEPVYVDSGAVEMASGSALRRSARLAAQRRVPVDPSVVTVNEEGTRDLPQAGPGPSTTDRRCAKRRSVIVEDVPEVEERVTEPLPDDGLLLEEVTARPILATDETGVVPMLHDAINNFDFPEVLKDTYLAGCDFQPIIARSDE
ncbi:hypothetical protein AAF712_014476 [Marasmius tenuissimus]|uniref:Polyprotein n=1 Tax=Marasmius tenuissimus TaxID=585030 RepID=A0ABR2ZBV4_9AGAR